MIANPWSRQQGHLTKQVRCRAETRLARHSADQMMPSRGELVNSFVIGLKEAAQVTFMVPAITPA
jgi:hypothetical protein